MEPNQRLQQLSEFAQNYTENSRHPEMTYLAVMLTMLDFSANRQEIQLQFSNYIRKKAEEAKKK